MRAEEIINPLEDPIPPLLWDLFSASIHLRISTQKLWALIEAGEIPIVRLGTAIFVRPEAVQNYLLQRSKEAQAARDGGLSK